MRQRILRWGRRFACPTQKPTHLSVKILVALFLISGAGSAQETEPALPRFVSTSQLVIETVSVTDKDGNPIKGLSAADFTVTENGVAQTIAVFEYQNLDLTPEPSAAEPEPAPAAAAPATENRLAPEPAGVLQYNNRRLLILYFDTSIMPLQDRLRALSAAQKFVTTQIAGPDLVAVMQYNGAAVKTLLEFTDDRDKILGAIDSLIPLEGLDETAITDAPDAGAAFGQDSSEFNLFNTDRQLAALQTAVQMLGRLNERKGLVYFASGLRLRGVDNQAQLRATLNSAIRANVNIFTVDARGLVAMAPMGDASQASPGNLSMYTGGAALAMATSFRRSQDTLYSLAADTGGKAFMDSNDLTMGITQAQRALSSYYIIGYYSTNSARDGKFRRVNIALKEIPGKLNYRQGYFAEKDFSKYTSSEKERQLEEALMLENPITDITIAMETNYFQLNRAEYYVPVVMKIPGSELALAKRGGAEHTVMDFIGEIKDEAGSTVQNLRDKVDIKLSDETAAQLAKVPIQYDTGYTLLPGTYTIKVLARDAETGRIGTYLNQFVIPNLIREDKRIPLSSVVLSSQRIDLKDALYTAGKDKEQAANPLVHSGQKLIPSVTRVFSKSKDMFVYAQAYQCEKAKAADACPSHPDPLVAYVTFFRGQAKAFETLPIQVNAVVDNKLNTAAVAFDLNLENLPAGRYECQVTVLDPARQKANFWRTPVALVP